MKQRILTFTSRFTAIDCYSFNLDNVTCQLNANGWVIKQIISTSFNHKIVGSTSEYPVMAITLLVEKPE